MKHIGIRRINVFLCVRQYISIFCTSNLTKYYPMFYFEFLSWESADAIIFWSAIHIKTHRFYPELQCSSNERIARYRKSIHSSTFGAQKVLNFINIHVQPETDVGRVAGAEKNRPLQRTKWIAASVHLLIFNLYDFYGTDSCFVSRLCFRWNFNSRTLE